MVHEADGNVIPLSFDVGFSVSAVGALACSSTGLYLLVNFNELVRISLSSKTETTLGTLDQAVVDIAVHPSTNQLFGWVANVGLVTIDENTLTTTVVQADACDSFCFATDVRLAFTKTGELKITLTLFNFRFLLDLNANSGFFEGTIQSISASSPLETAVNARNQVLVAGDGFFLAQSDSDNLAVASSGIDGTVEALAVCFA